MEPIIATILLLGLVAGILFKTYIPFSRKLNAGTINKFDPKYLWTAIAAFVGATISALGMFDAAAISWSEGWPFGTGYFALFGFGFLWAIGWNYGANNLVPPNTLPPHENPVQPQSADEIKVDEQKEARLI